MHRLLGFLLFLSVPAEMSAAEPAPWSQSEEGVLHGEAAEGAPVKRVAKDIETASAEVSVDIRIPAQSTGCAGLLLKVAVPDEASKPELTAYEVSLEPSTSRLILGLHRRGAYEVLQQIAAGVIPGQWRRLTVKMTSDGVLQASLDGKEITRYENSEDPIAPGSIGLRISSGAADFRSLKMKTKERERELPLKDLTQDGR